MKHSIPSVLLASSLAFASPCPVGNDNLALSVESSGHSAVLSNGYLCIVLNNGKISEARADFDGKGQWGYNAFADGGLTLQKLQADGSVSVVHSSSPINVIEHTEDVVSVQVDLADTSVKESWTISLNKNSRSYVHEFKGQLFQDDHFKCLRRQWEMSPSSIYAWYETGVVQMKAAYSFAPYHPSADDLLRVYALGGPNSDLAANVSFDIIPNYRDTKIQTVLMNTDSGSPYWSGFQELLIGNFGNDTSILDHWGNPWDKVATRSFKSGALWSHSLQVGINNWDFPVAKLSTESNLPRKDLHAIMTGIYASPVGCLCTHANEVEDGVQVDQIATSPARPDRGYQGTYNFFDPDNFFSITAMLWSNEPYLQEQSRRVLERSGEFLKETGQLPHHFEGTNPVYQALSGEIQTGPNIFWILSCFNYAKTTQNVEWLKSYMPKLRLASNFLFSSIDPEIGLANVPGSLMIDVFLRWNYTSDTNAELVGFFREFADAEETVGNVTGAADLRKLADTITVSMNKYLWSLDDDHYVTQWNGPFDNTTRDFVDYDSNLIAVAHGIPDKSRSERILKRIDKGTCRASSTWVSELYYDKENCQGGNNGDSWTGMARVAWFDALSRKRLGHLDEFDSLIMNPLQKILIGATWMHERLNCDGTQMENRTVMYFEYPSATSMLVRRVRYGIDIGLHQISISPFGVSEFTYNLGNIHIEFSPKFAKVDVPNLLPATRFSFDGLLPSSTYVVSSSCRLHQSTNDIQKAMSDDMGHLEFVLSSQGCEVSIQLAHSS